MSDKEYKNTTLKLKNDCTIYEATQLHHDVTKMLQQPTDVTIDASDVENIDASCLQVLIAAQYEAKKHNASFNMVGESEALSDLVNNIYCQSAIDIGEV